MHGRPVWCTWTLGDALDGGPGREGHALLGVEVTTDGAELRAENGAEGDLLSFDHGHDVAEVCCRRGDFGSDEPGANDDHPQRRPTGQHAGQGHAVFHGPHRQRVNPFRNWQVASARAGGDHDAISGAHGPAGEGNGHRFWIERSGGIAADELHVELCSALLAHEHRSFSGPLPRCNLLR